jgi:hypothetical protein
MRDKFQTQIVRIVPELVYYLLSDEYYTICTIVLVISQAVVFCLGGKIHTDAGIYSFMSLENRIGHILFLDLGSQ